MIWVQVSRHFILALFYNLRYKCFSFTRTFWLFAFDSLSWHNLTYFSHMVALASGSNMTEKEPLSSPIVSVHLSLEIVKCGPSGKPWPLMYFRFFLIFWATTKMSTMNRKMPYFLGAPVPEAKKAGPRVIRMRLLLTFFSKFGPNPL